MLSCNHGGDDYADDHDDETYGDDHSYGDDNHGDDHGCPTSMPETPGSDHAIILMMPIATTMMIIMIVMGHSCKIGNRCHRGTLKTQNIKLLKKWHFRLSMAFIKCF